MLCFDNYTHSPILTELHVRETIIIFYPHLKGRQIIGFESKIDGQHVLLTTQNACQGKFLAALSKIKQCIWSPCRELIGRRKKEQKQ